MAAKTAQKRGAQKRGETAPPAAIAALRRIAPAHVPDAALAALAKGGDAQKAKAEVTRWWREAAARATGAPTRKGQWWRELAASETDPISLEPLNRLRVEPFEIDEDGHKMLFDARVLAAYLVSSNVFANPLTRRPLRRETCASLDAHLEKHGRAKDATVARALDLSRDDDAQQRLQSVRREAALVLRALFGGDAESLGARQVRLAEDAARRAERGGGGLVVEDADVGVFQEAAPSAAPRPPPPDSAESYPVLESAPRRRDDAAFWARRAQAAPRGLFSAPPRPRAAPSTNDRLLARNRRLADAFGVDRQRAAQTVAWPPALVLCRAQNQPVSRSEMLIYTGPLGAADARDPRRRFGRGRRRVARVGAEAGAVLRGGRRGAAAGARDAGRLDPRRRGRGALRAPRGRIRRRRGAVPELPPLARRAAAAAAPERARRDRAAAARARADGAAAARARATVTHVVDLRPVHARERARHDGLPGVRRGATSGGRSRRPARRTGGAGAVSAARGDAYYLGNARVRRRRRRGRRRRLDAAVAREGVDRRAGRRVRLLPRALGVGKHESDGVLRYDPPRAVSFGLAGGRAAVVHGGRPRRRIGDVSQLQAGHPALNLRAAEPAHAVRLACLM